MEIPEGPAGTYATLNIMSRMVRQYKKSVPLRQLAVNVIQDLPGRKNFAGQAARLQDYVRNSIQYVKDINGVETASCGRRSGRKSTGC